MCGPIMAAAQMGSSIAGAQNSADYTNAQNRVQAQINRDQAVAQQDALNYDALVADNNALIQDANVDIAVWQAQDAIRQGEVSVQSLHMKAAGEKGSAKVRLAANGVDITEGSANDVLTSMDWANQVDTQTVRDNAMRVAWGHAIEAVNYANLAQAQRDSAANMRAGGRSISTDLRTPGLINPTAAAGASLINGASRVASQWYSQSANATFTPNYEGVGGNPYEGFDASANGGWGIE